MGHLDRVTLDASKYHLIGNALCLDYANTLYGHTGTVLHEYLHNYADLVVWSHRAGILDEATADKLLGRAARYPARAQAVFKRGIALRETIFRIFSALAGTSTPTRDDLIALNDAHKRALAHWQIERTPSGFEMEWNDPTALDRMLWPIALSAADLLTSPTIDRVRECSGHTCDWLFIDTSRNHMRRWCSMSVCGNRTKVRRFLERQRRTAQ